MSDKQCMPLINSHQQMHQNKFVTDFFIKRLPQYAFRHFYIAVIRGIVEVLYIDQCS
jgi:hypothetical protein